MEEKLNRDVIAFRHAIGLCQEIYISAIGSIPGGNSKEKELSWGQLNYTTVVRFRNVKRFQVEERVMSLWPICNMPRLNDKCQ